MRHHAELNDAARLGDGDWAEAVMRAHILFRAPRLGMSATHPHHAPAEEDADT